jgi:hypothetical protein
MYGTALFSLRWPGIGIASMKQSEMLIDDEALLSAVRPMVAATTSELRRWRDIAAIRHALARMLPERTGPIGLMEIAELCRRYAVAHPCQDCNVRRDQLLIIAVEWDISRDRLDLQSDSCLQSIAAFLR